MSKSVATAKPAKNNQFVDYVLELLVLLGGVSSRAMFGGHGIYKDGICFAIIAYDVLYLKVDEKNRADFEALGLMPFVYTGKAGGKPIRMSYHQCPEDALENPGVMKQWAGSGYAAALRARAKKTAKNVAR